MSKKWYKSTFVLPILLSLGLTIGSTQADAAGNAFTDYKQGDFGFESVSLLVSDGIIQGYKDNSFKPERAVSRIETAIMFKRALPIEGAINGSGFKDVSDSSEFAKATAAVKTAGIFKGSSNGTFGPNDLLTREQMASVIVRAFELEPISTINVTLNDLNQVSPSHVNDVKILFQNGITKGKNNGAFDPKGSVSRAEFSVFLHRALDDTPPKAEPIPGIPGAPGAPGVPGPVGNLQAEVTNTVLKTSDGKVNGQLTSNDQSVQITYNLKGQNPENKITDGKISVSEAVTLKITDAPSYVMLVFDQADLTQQLNPGENTLSFTEKLSGVKLGTISSFVDNFSVKGTISDNEGNSKPITINFIIK